MNFSSKRKKYFFENSSQGLYIFVFFILTVLAVILFVSLLLYFSTDTFSILYDNYTMRVGHGQLIFKKKLIAAIAFFIFSGGFGIILIVTRITHKTVGPVNKVETALNQMIEGKIPGKIFLRKHDHCKGLVDKMNRYTYLLKTNMCSLKDLCHEIDNKENPPAIDEISKRIKIIIGYIDSEEERKDGN